MAALAGLHGKVPARQQCISLLFISLLFSNVA